VHNEELNFTVTKYYHGDEIEDEVNGAPSTQGRRE